LLILLLAASGTALATGLGAIPVFLLGPRAASLRPLLLGIAAGTMSVASVVGLLLPGLGEGSAGSVCAGLAAGTLKKKSNKARKKCKRKASRLPV